MGSKKTSANKYAVPGLSLKDGHRVTVIPQGRLSVLNDLQLTLKHAHWNVMGRDFIESTKCWVLKLNLSGP